MSLSVTSQAAAGIPADGTSGSYQYTAQVVLTNVAVASPIALLPALFSVTTDSSRVVVPTAVTGCMSSERLAVGGRAMCGLQFTLTAPQRPTFVAYDDGAGHTARTAVPAVDLTPSPRDICIARGSVDFAASGCRDCVTRQCHAEEQAWGIATREIIRTRPCTCADGYSGSLCDCRVRCGESYWNAETAYSACILDRCGDTCR